jgi:hypothetical protein
MALPCSDMPNSRSSSPQWQYTPIHHIDSSNTQKVLLICRIIPRKYSYSVASWIPQRRKAKATPSSNLRRWQSSALSELELFVLFIDCINDEELTVSVRAMRGFAECAEPLKQAPIKMRR